MKQRGDRVNGRAERPAPDVGDQVMLLPDEARVKKVRAAVRFQKSARINRSRWLGGLRGWGCSPGFCTTYPFRREQGGSAMTSVTGDGCVEFRFYRPQASRVSVVGEFNSWIDGVLPMKPDGEGWWSASTKM